LLYTLNKPVEREDTMETVVSGGWLTVNRVCNLRCPWCYGSPTQFDPKATMSLDLAKNLLDLMGGLSIKNVIILGGEPTIYPHLSGVLKHASSLGINPVVVTNGLRLADIRFANELETLGLREITISVKTTDGKEYDELAPGRNGVLSEVCLAVQNAKKARLGTNISITLVRSFFKRLIQLVNLLVELDPSSVTIDMGSPVITQTGVEAVDILNPFELRDAVTVLHQLLKKTKLRYGFNVSIPLCILDKQTRDELVEEGRILTTCHVPKGKGVIFSPEGDVLVCNHFSPFPLGRFDVDFRTPSEFIDFWRSKNLTEIRNRSTLYPHERCRTCLDWDVCGGGCFVKWLYWDPQLFIPKEGR
jgi:radical SAM protein with 4Fe4S-binding SPASM domain